MAINKPRIGVSACLLGEAVRYDGGHKRNATLIDLVGPQVTLVTVCPEVEVGMTTPREPLQLVRSDNGVRMVTVGTGTDYTDRMNEWARMRVGELERTGLDGYVLKSGSPSCGLEVPALSEHSESKGLALSEHSESKGLFAIALMTSLPSLPVIDEKRLEDGVARAEFLERVFAYQSRKGQ